MKFTFEEWKFIQHCIECAGREFEKMMLDSTPSDKETSCYQIFKRQTEKANALVEKIKGCQQNSLYLELWIQLFFHPANSLDQLL